MKPSSFSFSQLQVPNKASDATATDINVAIFPTAISIFLLELLVMSKICLLDFNHFKYCSISLQFAIRQRRLLMDSHSSDWCLVSSVMSKSSAGAPEEAALHAAIRKPIGSMIRLRASVSKVCAIETAFLGFP